MHLLVALAAALRPSHRRTGSPCATCLAEEKGEPVRPDWKSEEPPSNKHDGRAVVAPLALKLNCTTMFHAEYVNLLVLESLISLLRRITREGMQRIHAWFRDRLERTNEFTKSQLVASNTGIFGALPMTSRWSEYGCPLWANRADAQTDRKLVCIVAEAPASNGRSLRISPCPLGASAPAGTACEHVGIPSLQK